MANDILSSDNTVKANEVGNALTYFLADTYTLYLKTQNFHWNVTGPQFSSLHLLFEAQYQELAEAVDVIAERIRSLRCVAPASFSHYLKLAKIKEENTVPAAKDMLVQLTQDNESLSAHANDLFKVAENDNDQASMDMLIERIRTHEKAAWMLRSHLE
jgi:starvation-inducible DNA-binding protein